MLLFISNVRSRMLPPVLLHLNALTPRSPLFMQGGPFLTAVSIISILVSLSGWLDATPWLTGAVRQAWEQQAWKGQLISEVLPAAVALLLGLISAVWAGLNWHRATQVGTTFQRTQMTRPPTLDEIASAVHAMPLEQWRPVSALPVHELLLRLRRRKVCLDGCTEREDLTRLLALRCTDTLCPVCYEEYAEGDELRVLPCGHYYHVACIDRWAFSNAAARMPSCPMCNRPVVDRPSAVTHVHW